MRPGRVKDQLSPDVYAPPVYPVLRAIYSFENSKRLRNREAQGLLSSYRRQLWNQSRQLRRLPRSYDSLLRTLLRSYAGLRRRRFLTGIPGSRGRSTSMTSLLPSMKPSLQPSTTLSNMNAWKRLLLCLGPLRSPTPRPTRSGVRSTSWNHSRRLLSSHTRYGRSGLSFDAGYSTLTSLGCCWQTRWVSVRPLRSLQLPFTPK